MDPRLAGYAADNAALNCTYTTVQKLSNQLGKLGVIVTKLVATNPQGPEMSYSTALQNGLQGADQLDWNILVEGNPDLQNAALVVADLAPLTYDAVWKVMSDLYPGQSEQMAAAGISRLPGIDAFLSQALS